MREIERLIQAADARAMAASRGVRAAVDALAAAAFQRMIELLGTDPGLAPREAIARAQAEFGGGFAQAMAEAFSGLLQRSIGVAQVLDWRVGEITLSRWLYLHAEEVVVEVAAIIREHLRGVQEARQLSLRLYDGYNPQDGIQRPLEGRARASLPKPLRTLTEDLPARRELTALQVAGQKQAARLKSPALRAAYLEAFDSWQQGAGMEAMKRRLEIAQREKNRFAADRIAQTELARAHQDAVARQLHDETAVDVVQVRMNPAHPKEDICDFHATADLWGLGPGCYPKAKAPVPPFHPFCWCRLKARPSLLAAMASEAEDGGGAYLREIGKTSAAAVMGTAERARRVMAGERAMDVANEGKARAYRTRTLAEVVRRDPPGP